MKKLTGILIAVLMLIICGISFGESDETDTQLWDWDWTDGQSSVLWISGEGKIPDYDSFEDTPWAEHAYDINAIVLDENITGIGKNAFNGFKQLIRVNYLEDTMPEIDESAFQGVRTIHRHYTDNESWPDDSTQGDEQWIYLPFYNDDMDDYNMVVYSEEGIWTIRDYNVNEDIPVQSFAQAREITWRSRNIDFWALPTEAEMKEISDGLSSTMTFSFFYKCKGNLSLDIPEGTYEGFSLDMEAPELSLTVHDLREEGEGLYHLVMSDGKIEYFGDIQTIELCCYFFGGPNDGHMIVNGQVEQLNFYNSENSNFFGGTAKVNGTIAELNEYGKVNVQVPNLDKPVTVSELICAKAENINQEGAIVTDGVLTVEGVEPIDQVSFDQFAPEYELVTDGWMLTLRARPDSESGGFYGVDRIALEEYKEGFSADDIWWGEYTRVNIVDDPYGPIEMNGREEDGKIFGASQIYISDGVVQVNCPVDTLVVGPLNGMIGTATVNVNAAVNYCQLSRIASASSVSIGTEGSIEGGGYERNINDSRYFDFVGPNTALFEDGQLKVMSHKSGEMLYSVLPSDGDVSEAAGQAATLDVGEAELDELSEEETSALDELLEEEGGAVSVLMDITVQALSDEEEGSPTGEMITELNQPVEIMVSGKPGMYVARLHRRDGKIRAERLSSSMKGNAISFRTDRFSKYALVGEPEKSFEEPEITITYVKADSSVIISFPWVEEAEEHEIHILDEDGNDLYDWGHVTWGLDHGSEQECEFQINTVQGEENRRMSEGEYIAEVILKAEGYEDGIFRKSFMVYDPLPDDSEFTLPASMEKIKMEAFEWTAVNVLTIPEDCVIIEENAFYNSDVDYVYILSSSLETLGENAFPEDALVFVQKDTVTAEVVEDAGYEFAYFR